MTDTPPPEPAPPVQEDADPTPDPQNADQQRDPEPAESANEAAKYRRKLRATEAERDQLQARLDHLQKSEVQRLAADRLADPADIWRDGAELSSLLDDDGHIDTSKVDNLITGLLEQHKHWAVSGRTPVHPDKLKSGAMAPRSAPAVSWAETIRTGLGIQGT